MKRVLFPYLKWISRLALGAMLLLIGFSGCAYWYIHTPEFQHWYVQQKFGNRAYPITGRDATRAADGGIPGR
jgi:hypothetical protein